MIVVMDSHNSRKTTRTTYFLYYTIAMMAMKSRFTKLHMPIILNNPIAIMLYNSILGPEYNPRELKFAGEVVDAGT